MNFRKITGWLLKSLKWGFLTLACIFALLLAINAVDEDPTPEMKALMAIPQVKADPANGYIAMVGLNAPPGEDTFKYGTRWVETFNATSASDAIKEALGRFPGDAHPFKGTDAQLCDPRKTPCLPRAREHAGTWRKLAADNESAIARQRQLLEYSQFEEIYFSPYLESPLLNYRVKDRLLALDLIALDAAEGRLEPALAALESRIAFDRRVLNGARNLLTGMLATNWLRQDYALLGEIVATHHANLTAQKPRLERMTEPLDIHQIRAIATRLFEGEGRFILNGLSESLGLTSNKKPGIFYISLGKPWPENKTMNSIDSLLTGPFLKSNATLNALARFHGMRQARISAFSPESAVTWSAEALPEVSRQEVAASDPYSLQILYNPIGKILLGYGAPDHTDNVLRLSDLMAVTRLARLQVELVTAGNTVADIPARIVANKARFNPYTGKPMGWDADKQQLYFDTLSKPAKGNAARIQVGIGFSGSTVSK